jgi:hypothetical protein
LALVQRCRHFFCRCICGKLGKTNSILAVALASDGRSIIGVKHEILGDKDLLSSPSVRIHLHVCGVVGLVEISVSRDKISTCRSVCCRLFLNKGTAGLLFPQFLVKGLDFLMPVFFKFLKSYSFIKTSPMGEMKINVYIKS